jgi:uncharacterized BrkB/YihY/UPF0761 family membrane protein
MSFIDIFSWFVLIVVLAMAVAAFVLMGMAPGHFAKRRGHPWADAVTIAGWVTLICGFVLWPLALIWAFVDVPAAPRAEARP